MAASPSCRSRSTTRCRRAKPNTNSCRSPLDQKLGGPRLEPDRRGPAVGQAPPQQGGARGHAARWRAGPSRRSRRERAVGHRRRAGGDRRGASAFRPRRSRWPGCSGGRGDFAHHRRAHRGAVPGQSRLCRREAHRRGARAARQGQPAAADLPLLASVQAAKRPPRTRRPRAACAIHEGVSGAAARDPAWLVFPSLQV